MYYINITFQCLINSIKAGLEHCKAYIDGAVIYSNERNQNSETINAFFDRLSEAKLTINLAKCEFYQANLTFLGHGVGQDQVKPVET